MAEKLASASRGTFSSRIVRRTAGGRDPRVGRCPFDGIQPGSQREFFQQADRLSSKHHRYQKCDAGDIAQRVEHDAGLQLPLAGSRKSPLRRQPPTRMSLTADRDPLGRAGGATGEQLHGHRFAGPSKGSLLPDSQAHRQWSPDFRGSLSTEMPIDPASRAADFASAVQSDGSPITAAKLRLRMSAAIPTETLSGIDHHRRSGSWPRMPRTQ